MRKLYISLKIKKSFLNKKMSIILILGLVKYYEEKDHIKANS